jgi:hypothetical protein
LQQHRQPTGTGIGISSSSSRSGDGIRGSSTIAAAAAAAAALDELDPGARFERTAGSLHAGSAAAAAAGAAGHDAGSVGSGSSDGEEQQQQQLPDDFDYSGEVPDHDHSQKRQELIIYAVPLTRGKVSRGITQVASRLSACCTQQPALRA